MDIPSKERPRLVPFRKGVGMFKGSGLPSPILFSNYRKIEGGI
jgi:hypothetical protein